MFPSIYAIGANKRIFSTTVSRRRILRFFRFMFETNPTFYCCIFLYSRCFWICGACFHDHFSQEVQCLRLYVDVCTEKRLGGRHLTKSHDACAPQDRRMRSKQVRESSRIPTVAASSGRSTALTTSQRATSYLVDRGPVLSERLDRPPICRCPEHGLRFFSPLCRAIHRTTVTSVVTVAIL